MTPSSNIREINQEEAADIFYRLTTYAFRATPPLPDPVDFKESIRMRRGNRFLAAFEDGEAVACAGGSALNQTVRGQMYRMGGIWGVATRPNARRKGYAKEMVRQLLETYHHEGRAYACLYPFRESFYERLGYVTFPQQRFMRFSPAALQDLMQQDLGGTVDFCLMEKGFEEYIHFLEKIAPGIHGFALFAYPDFYRASRNDRWVAFARVNGEVVGTMVYSLLGDAIGQLNLRAWRFYTSTNQGRYLLLDFIARHVDQATTAEIAAPPHEHPETWYHDFSFKHEPIFLAPMGRVLDVSLMGGFAAGAGEFSARIVDPLCPWNEGCWRFSSSGEKLEVSPAASAPFEMTIQGLSALTYGTNDPADFRFRGWGNPPVDVLPILRAMFTPQVPHLHEFF